MSRPPHPRTIANDLSGKIHNAMLAAGKYFSQDSFEARSLLRERDKLLQVDAYDAYIVSILAAEMFGDVDEARASYRRAAAIKANDAGEALFQLGQTLAGLGWFSEAQAVYNEVGSPDLGYFSHRAIFGMSSGALLQANAFVQRAEEIGIPVEPDLKHLIEQASAAFADAGTSDLQAGQLLDLAGEVMRERRLFMGARGPYSAVLDCAEMHAVHIEVPVKASLEDVTAMNYDLAGLVAERLDSVPAGVVVSFVRTKF